MGTVGQVVGTALMIWGNPYWAAAGFLLNSASSSRMPDQNVQGQRLGDLKVQNSQYGIPIPVVYGASRIAGDVIWSTDIIETAHTTTSGGGGGKGLGGGGGAVTQTNYTYSLSFAVALCEGEIAGIRKIWADGKLIYNLSDTADIATIIASNNKAAGLRIHTGSETQTADSLIQAHVGAVNCPAYRGTAYVVFDNLQLADFGNRTPNLEFEVVKAGASGFTLNNVAMPASTMWTCAIHDGVNLIATSLYPETIATSSDYGTTWQVRPHTTSMSGFQNIKSICLAGSKIIAFGQTGGSLENYLLASSDHGATWTYIPNFANLPGGGNVAVIASDSAGTTLVAFGNNITQFAVSINSGVTWSAYSSGFPAIGTACVLYGNGVFILVPTSGTTFWRSTNGLNWQAITIPGGGFSGGGSISSQNTGAYGNGLFVVVSYGYGGKSYVSSDAGLTWSENTTPAPYTYIAFGGGQFIAVQNGSANWGMSADGIAWEPYTASAVPIGGLTNVGGAIFAPQYTGSNTVSAYSANPTLSSTSTLLSAIVSDICTRAGLTAGQIDVTALTDIVDGYVVQRSTARSQIEQLMKAFYFDAVESDGKVKFVKRGGSAVEAISEDDLAAHVYGSQFPDNLLLERKQEMELPIEVDVQYMDKDAAYLINSQRSQRLITSSQNKQSVNLAISMSAAKAKQVADVLMYDAWTGRTTFAMANSWKYSYLEPTDVLTVTKAGRTYTARIVDEDASTGVYSRTAVLEDATVYTQTGNASYAPVPGSTVGLVPLTDLMLLDIPLLRDQDDGVGFYAAACGYGSGWTGAQTFKSNDGGATWSSFGNAFLNAAAIGSASTALGNFTQNIFDEGNSVTVVMLNGTLSSDTELNVLNGANIALLGNEIVQFKNATLTATNTYRLSGLLRGRFGTEWAASTHAIGDRFVLLTQLTTYLLPGASSEYDLLRKYRGVSFGGFLDDATIVDFTNTAVAQTPLSPVQLGGGRNASGDVMLNWIRRTRIGGGWNNYADVPLGEAAESYVVQICNNAGYGSVVRTITGLTAPTATYTAAQQTTDFGGTQSTVYWKAFQVSALVGNGYEARGAT